MDWLLVSKYAEGLESYSSYSARKTRDLSRCMEYAVLKSYFKIRFNLF